LTAIRTVITGDHVFHSGVPPTMQPNETFGHRKDWSKNCTICQEVELARDEDMNRRGALGDIEDARLQMLRDHVLGHENRLGIREWTGIAAAKLEEANRAFDDPGVDESAADIMWRFRGKLVEAGAVVLAGIEAIGRLTGK
jgi:hypothetical protein